MKFLFLQESITNQIVETLEKTVWQKIVDFLNLGFDIGKGDHESRVTILSATIVILIFIVTRFVFKFITKFITKRLANENIPKFESLFTFIKYFLYTIVGLIAFQSLGINLTPILLASSALLVGVGLALQTFFQDILSGIFILLDNSVKVGDIIELDKHVGRVEEIKLRTTRAVTIDNKVLIIPNHQYLTKSLYNWTQNGTTTRDAVEVSVAYGTDTNLVKKILLQAINEHSTILKYPEPLVLFENFGESSLDFKVIYTINDSFMGSIPRSDIRFKIDQLFKEHNIEIPFPQRVIHTID